jgi:hypothetical protein
VLGSNVLRAVATVARAFVLGSYVLLAVTIVARASSLLAASAAATAATADADAVAVVHVLTLENLVLPVVAAADAAVVRDLVCGTLARYPVTASTMWFSSAVAWACCFAWIGSPRGSHRAGPYVLRPRALR